MLSRRSILAVFFIALPAMMTGCQKNSPGVRFPVIYLDMDGTTLDSNQKVRPATLNALKRYRECGGHYGIATGRTLKQVEPYLGEIQPDLPIVLYNGAVVMSPDGKRTLASTPISREILQRVKATLKDQAGIIGIVVQGPGFTMVNEDSDHLREAFSSSFITDLRVDPTLSLQRNDLAIKMLMFVEPEAQESIAHRLREAVGSGARVIVTSPEAVEIVSPGVNKANSISTQLQARGYDLDEAITFGDSGNDVEMLTEAAFGVAMKNCRAEACRAALVTTDDNNSDAIGKLIEQVGLTKECREYLGK